MENNITNSNDNISSENEENKTMNEEQQIPPVTLSETQPGAIIDAPDEIAAIEIPESDIAEGLPEVTDDAMAEAVETNTGETVISSPVLEGTNETVMAESEVQAPSLADAEMAAGAADFIKKVEEELGEIVEDQHEAEIMKGEEDEFAHLETDENGAGTIEAVFAGNIDEHLAEKDQAHEPGQQAADESFEGMTREQLLAFVQNAPAHAEGKDMNKKVQAARSEFNKLIREERNEALENWKAEGNDEAAFVPEEEPLLQDFNAAFKSFKKSRADYVADVNIQKEKNLELKKEVLERLKTLTESEENAKNFNGFRQLQEEWRKIGHVPMADAENLWNNYNFYVNKFYEQRSLYTEFRDLDNKRNLTAKEEVVAHIEALQSMEDVNESFRLLKIYLEDWKHIGPVPRESSEPLFMRFRAAVISIYEKKEKQSEEVLARLEQNYEAKLALIDKIEEIAAFSSARVQDWITKNQELSQWIENWRSIGNIPYKRGTELKDRFSEAVKKFNKTKNNFFKDRKKEQNDNISKKTKLCEKMEAMVQAEDPAPNKKDLIAVQEEWKKSGSVPPKFSEKLWKRFQTASDAYFNRIIAGQGEAEKEQYKNLDLKNAVIDKIEALIKEEHIEAPEKQIKALQEEFNAIGYVPFKEKDKVRKRFFAALNNLIAKAGAKGSTGQKNELVSYRLTVQSWAQEQGGGARLEQEEKKVTRELKRLETEVSTLENNIEFFRNSKNAGDIRAKMEGQIADLKNQVAQYQDKLKAIRQSGRR